MKFGVREICDVVLRAKDAITIGSREFDKDEPVIYFDSAKTSTIESAATTVYATGGRGNSRLLAWEGEKTVTFTMEDALLSPLGFSILSGAGLAEASATNKIHVHTNLTGLGTSEADGSYSIAFGAGTINDSFKLGANQSVSKVGKIYGYIMENGMIKQVLKGGTATVASDAITFDFPAASEASVYNLDMVTIMVDFYIEASGGATELTITPDKFGGYYYLEASTLFRRQDTGKDMPAVFVVPKVKIQSNFTFSMASSGDPSTFTFTMDAFPDYTSFDKSKQVLFALQILE